MAVEAITVILAFEPTLAALPRTQTHLLAVDLRRNSTPRTRIGQIPGVTHPGERRRNAHQRDCCEDRAETHNKPLLHLRLLSLSGPTRRFLECTHRKPACDKAALRRG
jgi:hypothetical protein